MAPEENRVQRQCEVVPDLQHTCLHTQTDPCTFECEVSQTQSRSAFRCDLDVILEVILEVVSEGVLAPS